jgi:hypothetical protein
LEADECGSEGCEVDDGGGDLRVGAVQEFDGLGER